MIPERIAAKTRIYPSGCVLWTGALSRSGYGNTFLNGKYVGAHRVFYEAFAGPIPDGMQLDHLCRNRACVNVSHLEPVTQRENLRRGYSPVGVNARKTVCDKGHALIGSNLKVESRGRRCLTCRRAKDRARRGKLEVASG